MVISTHDGQLYEDEASFWLNQPMEGSEDLKRSPNYNPQTDVYQASSEEPKDHKVFFVRHGETEDNEDNVIRTKDAKLTDEGRKQAEVAAKQLKSEGVDAIVSSNLPRAKESAHIIAAKLGIVPQFDDKLNTWDMGKLEGQPCDSTNTKLMKDAVEKTPDEPVGGGESFNDFKDRSQAGIRDAINNNPNKKLAILTHSKVEATLKAWEKTGQGNPSIDAPTVSKEPDKPGSVEPFTMKANSTIMQGDSFDQRFSGMPHQLPVEAPGESFEGTPSLYHPDLRMPKPFPGTYPYGYEDFKNAPYQDQKDLDLYNPVADIYDPKKVGGHVDPSEFLNPMPGSKFATTGPARDAGGRFVKGGEGFPGPRNMNPRSLDNLRPSSKIYDPKELQALVDKGLNSKEIAKELNITPENARVRLSREGIKLRPEPTEPKSNLEMFEENILPDGIIQRLYRNPSQQQQGKAPETIAAAAIKANGKIFTGTHHFEALDKIDALHGEGWIKKDQYKEGFVTSKGRFVDREEAAKIADAIGQRDSKGHPSAISQEFNFEELE